MRAVSGYKAQLDEKEGKVGVWGDDDGVVEGVRGGAAPEGREQEQWRADATTPAGAVATDRAEEAADAGRAEEREEQSGVPAGGHAARQGANRVDSLCVGVWRVTDA